MCHPSIIAGHWLTFPIAFGLTAVIVSLMLWASVPKTITSRERISNLVVGLIGGLCVIVPLIAYELNNRGEPYSEWYKPIQDYLVFALAGAFAVGSVSAILLFRRMSGR